MNMKITKTQPYSDEKLTWNKETGRYELSFTFVNSEYDNNFKSDAVLKKRLKKNSRLIYNFIFYRSNSMNKVVVEYLLNHTKEGRDFLFDVLTTQFEADNESGYNDLGDTAPINVSNGQSIDRNLLWANQVSVSTEQIIDNSSRYFGINLMYQAVFPWIYFEMVREGTK